LKRGKEVTGLPPEFAECVAITRRHQPLRNITVKKLLIAATLAAAAVAATPLLAHQTGDKPAGTAATEAGQRARCAG
jgi:hypothetical protein